MNENTITCAACGCIMSEDEIVVLSDGTTICRDCATMLEEEEIVRCSECGKFIRKDEAIEYDDRFLCDGCRDDLDLEFCDSCGEWHPADDFNEIECGWGRRNYRMCSACTEQAVYRGDVFWCDDCQTYNESATINRYTLRNGDTICEDCFDNNDYCICADCGEVLRTWDAVWSEEDEEWYCRDCYRPSSKRIHDYCFRPEAVFHGLHKTFSWEYPSFGDPITIGFELEVDHGDDRQGCANELTSTFDEDTLYLKNDGSVDFEIVTHPHTLEAYMNELDLDKLCCIPPKYGYSSHNAGTCGLHCHVGRSQLGEDATMRWSVITRIALLMYRHWDSLVVFSRRKESQLSHWANAPQFSFDYGRTYNDAELAALVRKYYAPRGRYQALNLEPSQTIEFRLWRGTLVPETLKATLQLTSNIVEFCMNNTLEKVANSTWEEVTGYKHYSELENYLVSRDIVAGRETKRIPYDGVVISGKEKYGFDLGEYVEIVNDEGELVASATIGARGTVASYNDGPDDDRRVLILFDTGDPETERIARIYAHFAGGLAPQNNGYWAYPQNLRTCVRRS